MVIEFKCSCCGKDLKNINYYIDENNNLVCSACAEIHYKYCDCGTLIKKSECRSICLNCDNVVYTNVVNGYGTKPIPRFKNKNNIDKNLNNRYFGLELEYSNLKPVLAKVLFKDLYNNKMIYNKRDGSLCNGVEIVTNPLDMPTARKLFKDMEIGFGIIKQIQGHTDNAGVHIHVNKKSISPMSRIKLGYLLNNNWNIKDRRFLMYLSGRICTLDTDIDIGDNYCTTGTQTSFKKFGKYNDNRHIALNFNNNDTIEFRIYKASADVDTILSYIETTNLMIEYCDSSGIKDININNFALYILENSKNKILISKVEKYFKDRNKNKLTNSYSVDLNFIDNLGNDDLIKLFYNISNANSLSGVLRGIDEFQLGMYRDSYTGCSEYIKETSIYKKIDDRLRKYLLDKITEGAGV